jgi:malate dehydrogenase
MEKNKLKVCVTGAAGNLAYCFLPMLATGQAFGSRVSLHLTLLDLPHKEYALKGIALELEDGAFPLLTAVEYGSDPKAMFKDCNVVIFMGGASRQPGQERRDLLKVNGTIFQEQGEALNEVANPNCRCLVVANPCNTNCYILQKYCPKLPKKNFTCLNRLDHNRALSQVSKKLGVDVSKIKKVTVWGNHSVYQYPDLSKAEINGEKVEELIGDQNYVKKEFINIVQQRGAEVLLQKKKSAVLSGATAICDHLKDWYLGTPKDDWVSMGVVSDGSYGVPEGLVFSFPVVCENFEFNIVKGLEQSDFCKERLHIAIDELVDEKDEAMDAILLHQLGSRTEL